MKIKCEYCDRYNDNSLRDCPSCGASINYNPQIEYHEIELLRAKQRLQDLKIQQQTSRLFDELKNVNPMLQIRAPVLPTCMIRY